MAGSSFRIVWKLHHFFFVINEQMNMHTNDEDEVMAASIFCRNKKGKYKNQICDFASTTGWP